jgi:hypothetical protein
MSEYLNNKMKKIYHQKNNTMKSHLHYLKQNNFINNQINFKKAISILFFALILSGEKGWGQVNLTAALPSYSQNFDGMGTGTITWTDNTSIVGWYASNNSGSINATSVVAGTGSSATGGHYNFGSSAAADRALGVLTTGSTPNTNLYVGVRLKNNDGIQNVTSISITYTGEEWRSNSGTNPLAFSYQVGATTLLAGTWTPNTALDFAAITTLSGTAQDGNNVAWRAVKTGSITVTLTPGSEIWLRWNKTGSNSCGLSVDDFSVTATYAAAPGTFTPGALSAFGNVCVNTIAGPNSFSLSGSGLDGSTVTVGPLAGFTFDNGSGYGATATVTGYGTSFSTTINVKFNPTAAQAYGGTGVNGIPISGGNGSAIHVDALGTGIAVPSITAASASPNPSCSGSNVVISSTPTTVSSSVAVGSATGSSTVGSTPYRTSGTTAVRTQYIFTAAELSGIGMVANSNINSLAFNVTTAQNIQMTSYTISIAATASTSFSSTAYLTGTFIQVYGPQSYTAVSGVNTHTFSTPFTWNGTSGIVINLCYNTPGSTASTVSINTLGSNVTNSNTGSSICSTGGGNLIADRPIVTFGYSTNPNPNIYNWSWSPGGATSNNPTVNPTSDQLYTVTATTPGSSCTASSSINVLVDPTTVPGSVTGGTSPICLGSGTGTMNLGAHTGAIDKWQRQLNGGGYTDIPSSAGLTSYNETPSSAGTWDYRAVVHSGACGALNSTAVTIQVDATTVPGSVTGGTSPICLGSGTGTMSLGVHNGIVDKWQKQLNGGGYTDIPSTIGLTSYSETPSSAGTWDYRAVVHNGSCGALNSAANSITVNTLSVAPTGATGITTICNGGSTTLTVDGGSAGTGATAEWFTGSCGGTSAGTGNSILISPSSTETYYVRYNGTCNTTTCGTVTVTVNDSSAAPTGATGTTTICNGGSTTLTVDGGTAGTGATTEWFTGSCGGTSAGTGNSILISPASTETYYVHYNGTCNVTACGTVTVTVNTLSTAPTDITSDDANNEICSGQNVLFTANGGALGSSPGTSYQWYEGGCGTGSSLGSASTLNVMNPTVGSHTYYARIEDACGNTSCASITILVSVAPPINGALTVTGPSDACSGSVGLITVNPVSGSNIHYSWNTGTNSSVALFSTTIGGPFSPGPFSTPSNQVYAQFGSLIGSSGYNVCVQGVNDCGSTNNKCTWVRGTVGTPGAITPAANAVACPNDVKSYSCGASGGASVYSWTLSGSPAPITSGQGTTSIQVTFPVAFTSGQLCVTAALSCGGSSTSAARCMNISKSPAIPAVISGVSKVCPGSTGVVFSVPTVTGATGYNWIVPAGATITNNVPSTTITVSFPAAYPAPGGNVCVTATSACGASVQRCKSVGSYIPAQPGNITGPLNNLCSSTVQYSILNVAGATGYTWINPAGTTISNGQNTTTILLSVGPTFTSGNLTVSANTNACAPGSGPGRTVPLVGKPGIPGTITSTPGSWCNGGFVSFSIPTVAPLPLYNWLMPNGTITAGQGSNNIDVTWGTGTGNVSVTAYNGCGVSGIRTQSFSTLCREEELNTADNFSIYPNPAHDNITVSIYANEPTGFMMQLKDVSGRTVFSQSSTGAEGLNLFNLDLSHLSKGVYMLDVKSTSNSWKSKVLVE